MEIRSRIEEIFEGKAFLRPLFYSYPGGLRFVLSKGGSAIEQFLLALRTSSTICPDIFNNEPIIACIRSIAYDSKFGHRKCLAELRAAEILIPKQREIWLNPIEVEDRFDEDVEQWYVNVAFEIPATYLENLLWCALVRDFGTIRPNPPCSIYLFNLNQRILVLPYDDRGMDVVGPNSEMLSALYAKHSAHLLDYDRPRMDATFGAYPPK